MFNRFRVICTSGRFASSSSNLHPVNASLVSFDGEVAERQKVSRITKTQSKLEKWMEGKNPIICLIQRNSVYTSLGIYTLLERKKNELKWQSKVGEVYLESSVRRYSD